LKEELNNEEKQRSLENFKVDKLRKVNQLRKSTKPLSEPTKQLIESGWQPYPFIAKLELELPM
jgi:hypothetical protein